MLFYRPSILTAAGKMPALPDVQVLAQQAAVGVERLLPQRAAAKYAHKYRTDHDTNHFPPPWFWLYTAVV